MKDAQSILYDYAMSFVGLPYIWGGDDPILGWDCSGLCIEILRSCGALPTKGDWTASGLRELYKDRLLPRAKFGALAFYGHEKISHVGFCLSDRTMLEAGGGGSATTSRDIAARQNAFIRIRPVLSRMDIQGVYMPKYAWEV